MQTLFQRLTYEEKMARRLLGPENAASVLDLQKTENEQISQVMQSFPFKVRLDFGEYVERFLLMGLSEESLTLLI